MTCLSKLPTIYRYCQLVFTQLATCPRTSLASFFPPPLQHAVTPEDLFMLLIKLITNDVLPPVQTADTYPTSQSCSSWLSCLRRAKLAGLWPVCKKNLIPPVWCDTSWRDLVKRRALWCQEGCFECVGNILKLPLNTSHSEGVKNRGRFKNLRIHSLRLDLQISVQTCQ